MKYLIAFLHTIGLMGFTMIMTPAIQWYENTFLNEGCKADGLKAVTFLIIIGFAVITWFRWMVAFESDSSFKVSKRKKNKYAPRSN